MKLKEFLKPTKGKIILFIMMSLIFLGFRLITLFKNLQFEIDFYQIFILLIGIIFFAFCYLVVYIISCFLIYLHKRIFPYKNWKLFIIIFLLILILANIPGIGTTPYSATPRPTGCLAQVGAPCLQNECPPDCIYSVKVRPLFWPWKQKIILDYQTTGYYGKESFLETIPIIGLFNYEAYGMTYHWNIIGNTKYEEFLGTILLLALTSSYWYLLACLLSHGIIFSINKLRKKKR